MAGYADALAALLYPNSAQNSMYTMAGQGISKMTLPTFESPWATGLASALQGLAGAGLQGYGVYSANKENAENAAQMVPKLGEMGVQVPEGVAAGLSSEDPQTRALALALTEQQMKNADAQVAAKSEIEKYRQQQDIQFENQRKLKQMEIDQKRGEEAEQAAQQRLANTEKLRSSLNSLKETQDFKSASIAFNAMEKAAGMDSEAANLFFKKAFERTSNPGSVVSPTEAAALDNMQSFYDQNKGALDKFFTGNGTLQKPIKDQMLMIAKNYRDGIASTYEQAAQPYLMDAEDAGIKADRILTVPFLKRPKEAAEQLGLTPAAPMVSMQAPSDNVSNPLGLPPAPAGHEYRMSPDGIVLVRK